MITSCLSSQLALGFVADNTRLLKSFDSVFLVVANNIIYWPFLTSLAQFQTNGREMLYFVVVPFTGVSQTGWRRGEWIIAP